VTQINTRPFFLCFFFLLLFFYQAIFIISDLVPFQQDGGFGYYGQMILSNYRSRGFNQMLNRKCNIEGHPVVPIGENNMQRDCKYCLLHSTRSFTYQFRLDQYIFEMAFRTQIRHETLQSSFVTSYLRNTDSHYKFHI
jgi:hypothetical protein